MTSTDLFATPMIFLRVTWMTGYKGNVSHDTPTGGGAFVAKHGFGHEIFNFQPHRGAMYGYVQPPGRNEQWAEAKINLTRLGASANDRSVPDVLAVWVATSPDGGAYIVGWYKNATVFRDWQPAPTGSSRNHESTDCGYFVTARRQDAVLLLPHERVFAVPQKVKGGFGQANIWYANNPMQHRTFREDVLRYIERRHLPQRTKKAHAHQTDPLIRQKVEKIAVETTSRHFDELGYVVTSVERDNVGWDLVAALDKRKLKLEVKGLSGDAIVVELTPNEYKALKLHSESYKLCVVSSALKKPRLTVFGYNADSSRWESTDGLVLNLQEMVAVRCIAM